MVMPNGKDPWERGRKTWVPTKETPLPPWERGAALPFRTPPPPPSPPPPAPPPEEEMPPWEQPVEGGWVRALQKWWEKVPEVGWAVAAFPEIAMLERLEQYGALTPDQEKRLMQIRATGEWGIPGAPGEEGEDKAKTSEELIDLVLSLRSAEELADFYASYPPKKEPGGMNKTEEVAWLNENAYYSVYTDEKGNILSLEEVKDLGSTDPYAVVKQVWLTGGEGEGSVTEGFFFAKDFFTAEEKVAAFQEEQMLVPMREKAEREAQYRTEEAEILRNPDMTSNDKFLALVDIYAKYEMSQDISGSINQGEMFGLRNKARESLTPEQLAAEERAKPGWGEEPELPEWKAPEKVDIGELTAQVSPFGITVMSDYPYLSPITEAHLRRLSQPVLEMMAKYLSEKGISWRDWLTLSTGGFYGGAPAGRMPAWGTPRQW